MSWVDRSRRVLVLAALSATAAVACGVTNGSASGGSTSASPPAATTDGPTTAGGAGSPATTSSPGAGSEPIDSRDLTLELRPVLDAAQASTDGSCDELESRTRSTTPSAGSDHPDGTWLVTGEGTSCFLVGPAAATGSELSNARAELLLGGGWGIEVEARGEARAKLNQLFDACFESTPTCPGSFGNGTSGSVAIVLDGVVVSAPTVNAPGLADDSFTISGNFTEDESREIALALRMGG